jgi:hypothetical protein
MKTILVIIALGLNLGAALAALWKHSGKRRNP